MLSLSKRRVDPSIPFFKRENARVKLKLLENRMCSYFVLIFHSHISTKLYQPLSKSFTVKGFLGHISPFKSERSCSVVNFLRLYAVLKLISPWNGMKSTPRFEISRLYSSEEAKVNQANYYSLQLVKQDHVTISVVVYERDYFFKILVKSQSKEPNFLVYCSNCGRSFSKLNGILSCLLYTSPSPRDLSTSRMPSSA